MKRFALMAVIALLSFSSAHAQSEKHNNWHQKMMSEKIAFITMKLNLTPEEAQVFWPVYNQISKEKFELQKQVKVAYMELKKALNEGTASDKEIDKLLDKYLEAKLAAEMSGKGEADKYRKVLSGKKVAKLYIAEESFRRQHINSIKGGHHGHKPGNASRPEGSQGNGPKGAK